MRRGSAWEAQLEALHDRYRREQLAVILRGHQPVTVQSKNGSHFYGHFAGDGPPDFMGCLGVKSTWSPGRVVAFDAKDCQAKRFPLHQIERHQARDLEAVYLATGIAFIALRLQGEAFALPWAYLRESYWPWWESDERARKGSASLVREDWWLPFVVEAEGWLPVLHRADQLAGTYRLPAAS
ncbi:MAG TPA: Holliday junction resolvase RecU [Phycisphaerales bacterium]|nr:Holliday junction resolvase RecU [Phycisphaerales bacterium]